MRGENRQGRFNIDHERQSIISGTTKELVELTGNMIDWWFFDEDNTVIDPIYDVGSDGVGGGRKWIGPLRLPTVNATIEQGVTIQSDRGFYNTDVLMLTLNMDIIKDSGSLLGANAATRPRLDRIETNPDHYLKDRVVYRGEVFSPRKVYPRGLITDKYTLITIQCNQVNAEELVNDSQFQTYANYDPLAQI
jgi:hypothetical protein